MHIEDKTDSVPTKYPPREREIAAVVLQIDAKGVHLVAVIGCLASLRTYFKNSESF